MLARIVILGSSSSSSSSTSSNSKLILLLYPVLLASRICTRYIQRLFKFVKPTHATWKVAPRAHIPQEVVFTSD